MTPVSAPFDSGFDTKALRNAFGAFASGVTVVTTVDQNDSPTGFTANSFTSVSLDPPLLSVCLGRAASTLATFTGSASFAVNILSAKQTHIARQFAARGVNDRFSGIDWQTMATGAPLLSGCVATFDCTMQDCLEAGDHVIFIGRVVAFDRHALRPLLFVDGQFQELCSVESASQHPLPEGRKHLQTAPNGKEISR